MAATNQGEVWARRHAAARAQFPELATDDWKDELDDIDFVGRILLDVLRVGTGPGRRGHRLVPEPADGAARFRELIGDDWTSDPFPAAFAELAVGLTIAEIAEATGISTSKVHRLLRGERPPTFTDMRTIAVAFGKTPIWFHEYRVELVCSAVATVLLEHPERSATFANRLVLALER